MAATKVSFTVRRPSPVSRDASSGPDSDVDGPFRKPALPKHLANETSLPGSPLARSATSSPKGKAITYYDGEPDSSSDEDEEQDELVTGFDRFGVERKDRAKADNGKKNPLIIPALKNRDWRELARKRKSAGQYVPESALAKTGADGSVGGLGTRDVINSGPELTGLQLPVKRHLGEVSPDQDAHMSSPHNETGDESEDAAALRAILAESTGQSSSTMTIAAIAPVASEKDALDQDIIDLPESASLDDYARVPVEQFGAALLRGMGWKEGTAASRKPGRGMVQPWIPEARPALLGIGAKERVPLDDGSVKKKGRPDKKYVPLVKQEREPGSSSSRDRERERDKGRDDPRRSRSPASRREPHSRRSSRSPPPKRREYDNDDRRGGSYRRNDYGRDGDNSSYKDRRKNGSRDRERSSKRY